MPQGEAVVISNNLLITQQHFHHIHHQQQHIPHIHHQHYPKQQQHIHNQHQQQHKRNQQQQSLERQHQQQSLERQQQLQILERQHPKQSLERQHRQQSLERQHQQESLERQHQKQSLERQHRKQSLERQHQQQSLERQHQQQSLYPCLRHGRRSCQRHSCQKSKKRQGSKNGSIQREKALAATGHQDVQLASDWLLNHCNDPTLDQQVPREYILYAVAVGPLGDALDEFWNQSLARCGRNGAHTLLPHVTLCQFFQVPDSNVETLTQALQAASDICQKDAPESIGLERYSSPNFIGLFIEDSHADYMRKFTQEFATQASKSVGIKVEPHKKQLHLTLAYQFHAVHHDMLKELSDVININAPARWEYRLYSRDPRSGKAEVLRVLYAHTPRADDELELVPDDYVFLPSGEVHNSSDGWFKGTSYLTGCQGVFPGNYTEKAPESDTWTVHRSIPLTRSRDRAGQEIILNQKVPSPPPPEGADEAGSIRYKNTAGLLTSEKDRQYDNVVRLQKQSLMRANGPSPKPQEAKAETTGPKAETTGPDPAPVDLTPKKPRRLYVVRHAERVDISFGQQWIQHCFDSNGKYQRKNLNMPKRVPTRVGSPGSFSRDSVITEMGQFQARLTGDAMKEAGIKISHVFSSPAIRCIQTAHAIVKGLDSAAAGVKIKVDTSLFEWLAWSRGVLPKWMTLQEITKFNLTVDLAYKELINASDLDIQENCQRYYKRSDTFVRHILKEYPEGDILLVGHASSLDGLTRCLQGLSARQAVEFSKIVQKVPYCGAVAIEEYADLHIWDLIQPPFATLTHAPNGRFDWRIMQQ